MTARLVSSFLSEPSAVVFFAWDVAWKAGILILAAGLAHLLAGRRRVLVRSAIWYLCLVGLLFLPVVVALGPRMAVAVLDSEPVNRAMPLAVVEWPVLAADADARVIAIEQDDLTSGDTSESSISRAIGGAASNVPAVESQVLPNGRGRNSRDIAAISAVVVYLLVVAWLVIRLMMSLAAVAALRRSGVAVVNSAWLDGLERWCHTIGFQSSVALRETAKVSVPVVIGGRKPTILLPVELAQSSDRQVIDAVLVHELTHVARSDYAWNLLLRVVQAFYWPHPLVWLAGRIVRQVREEACDAVCIHWMGDVRTYCAILVDVAAGLARRPDVVLGMAMTPSSRLSRRLARIESSPGSTCGFLQRRARMGIALVIAGIVAPLGAVRLVHQASATEQESNRAKADTDDRPLEIKPEAGQPATVVDQAPGNTKRANPPSGKTPRRTKGTAKSNSRIDPEANNGYWAWVWPESKPNGQACWIGKVKRGKIEMLVVDRVHLEAHGQVSVRLRNAGIISKAPVEVGDQVKAGQVLAEIDVPEIDADIADKEAALAQTQAAEEQAQASVEAAEASLAAHEANLLAARAEHEKAASNEKFRRIQYDRMKKLFETKSVSAEILDEKEEQFESAVAATKSAEAKVQTATAELQKGKVDVRVAKAALKAAVLDTASAKADLGRSRSMTTDAFRLIRSPIDGVVLEKNVEEDMVVKLGDAKPLYRLATTRFLTAVVHLAEADAVQVKRDNPARVEIDALPNHEPVVGKVSRVEYAMRQGTNTYRAEITIPNAEGRLKPGFTGEARIVVGEIEEALSAPRLSFENFAQFEDGVIEETGPIDAVCYRVVDGKINRVNVKLGYIQYPPPRLSVGTAEILEGLKEGDEIIFDPPRGLEDGQSVQVDRQEKK